MKIEISPGAAADIERLRLFLETVAPLASAKTTSALNTAIQTLDVFPSRGRRISETGIRELFVPFGRAGYLIRYVVVPESDLVLILGVRHGRENG